MTTGGSTSGRWTTPFRIDLPQNRPRARASATSTPSGRLTSMAQSETFRLSRIAVSSSGVKSNT